MADRRISWVNLGLPEPEPTPELVPSRDGPPREIAFDKPQPGLSLVGCYDPLDGTVLVEGERAVVCLSCNTGYHQTSWDFLAQRNNGACANCRKSSNFTVLRLIAGALPVPAASDPHATVVGLADLPALVGHVVVFEGFVFAHQISSRSGTHFIKFHADPNPFTGFNLVIFEHDAHKWRKRGIDPASYVNHTIQVRGLLKDHPAYGLEILPKSPAQIRVLSDSHKS